MTQLSTELRIELLSGRCDIPQYFGLIICAREDFDILIDTVKSYDKGMVTINNHRNSRKLKLMTGGYIHLIDLESKLSKGDFGGYEITSAFIDNKIIGRDVSVDEDLLQFIVTRLRSKAEVHSRMVIC